MPLPKSEVTSELYSYIAPHILGNNLLKQFLTLQMFVNPNEGEKLHLLIIGSTATGKTEICMSIKKVMLGRSAFIQKDATAVGVREKLMLSPQILFCDEFDKMKRDTRTMLLEAMQSQTVTIDKHGEHGTTNAKVSITALCNPVRVELSKDAPLVSQISFSNEFYLLSRMNFVIPVYPAESYLYGDIAERMENKRYTEEDIINKLREIVYTIKQEIPSVKIELSLARKVGEYIKYLKEMNPNNILITPRLIEGFLSAMKAHSRMCQRKECDESDLEYIKHLYEQLL